MSETSTKEEMVVVNVPLNKLDDRTENNYARGQITPADVENLKQSIAQDRLYQPVIVSPNDDGTYRLVAGFRRTFAYRLLGRETIPAVIRKCDDVEALYINIGENLKRQDLNKLQEARAVKKIMEKQPHLNEFDIANKLGTSRGWVQIRKYILELPEVIQEEISKDMLTVEQIRLIWQLPTEAAKYECVRKIKEKKFRGQKINLDDMKREVMNRPKAKKVQDRPRIFFLQDLIRDHLGNSLTTRVLAWAAGEIPDAEILRDIEVNCEHAGVPFKPPGEMPKEE